MKARAQYRKPCRLVGKRGRLVTRAAHSRRKRAGKKYARSNCPGKGNR